MQALLLRYGAVGATFVVMGCGGVSVAPRPPPTGTASLVTARAPASKETSPAPPAMVPALSSDDAHTRAALLNAKDSFQAFVQRANGKPEYAAAVRDALQRITDIDRTLTFMVEPVAQ
jgi:hypothetical protein